MLVVAFVAVCCYRQVGPACRVRSRFLMEGGGEKEWKSGLPKSAVAAAAAAAAAVLKRGGWEGGRCWCCYPRQTSPAYNFLAFMERGLLYFGQESSTLALVGAPALVFHVMVGRAAFRCKNK